MHDPVPIGSPEELAIAVRERRRELGLSQQQLAERLGVSRQWVVGLEAGRPRAELGLVLRALRSLDLRVLIEPMPSGSIDLDALLGGG
jgi:HTH-type transcriptional regulator/antitoxin HipB